MKTIVQFAEKYLSESVVKSIFWLAGRALFYPKVLRNLLHHYSSPDKKPYFSKITDNIYLGSAPFWFHVSNLREMGITAVVNMCEEYSGPITTYKKHGIRQYRVPSIDYIHPSLDEVQLAVDFLKKELENGGNVLVHCKSGKGRSATVVLCHLLDEDEEGNIHEVYGVMKQQRRAIAKDLPHRPVVKAYLKHSDEKGHRAKKWRQ
mmetsp:Transcript_32636/g.84273  ORF Transcript_32636/g.84273 Transcript_32636/m.84273 type:complete len:205 (-) Transcript_32636:1034-1648(-)